MTEYREKPSSTSTEVSATPPADNDEHKFGDTATQKSKQEIAEDEAAEQLGNFA